MMITVDQLRAMARGKPNAERALYHMGPSSALTNRLNSSLANTDLLRNRPT